MLTHRFTDFFLFSLCESLSGEIPAPDAFSSGLTGRSEVRLIETGLAPLTARPSVLPFMRNGSANAPWLPVSSATRLQRPDTARDLSTCMQLSHVCRCTVPASMTTTTTRTKKQNTTQDLLSGSLSCSKVLWVCVRELVLMIPGKLSRGIRCAVIFVSTNFISKSLSHVENKQNKKHFICYLKPLI